MIVVGVILMVAGAASLIVGFSQNSSLEAQFTSILSSGATNPGTPWIIAGAIVATIGLVLLIAGVVKKSKNG